MIYPFDDSLIDEKNKVQKNILEEAKGDLKEYSRIIRKEAEELRKKNKNKFNKIYTPQEIKK